MKKKRTTSTKSQLTTRTTSAPMIVRAPAKETPATPAPVTLEPTPAVTAAQPVELDRDLVAQRAFAKFAARGYAHGHALEDWLTAEAELRASLAVRAAKA